MIFPIGTMVVVSNLDESLPGNPGVDDSMLALVGKTLVIDDLYHSGSGNTWYYVRGYCEVFDHRWLTPVKPKERFYG